ncbi:MAG: hypothetical protein WBD28_11500, partial [Candidatus Zixiibacteriota bacterium]
MTTKGTILKLGILALSVVFIYQTPAFSQTSFSVKSDQTLTYLTNPHSSQNKLKSSTRSGLLHPVVSYQKKESFLGGIFPAKNVPSRRVVAKIGVGLANEFSGFYWTADKDEFKDGGSIYPLHLGLTLQISMFHGLFLDVGYQMNKELTKTFAKSKGYGSVNYTEIFTTLNLIPPGSFNVDSEGKSYNEGYIGIGIARYMNKKIELRGKITDWDLTYEENFGFLVKAGGQAHKVKWAQPFGLYAEVTLKYVPWKLKEVKTKPWDGEWEDLSIDEAYEVTTDFTN